MTAIEPLESRKLWMEPRDRSFIEVQFPVSRLSKESYTERKAVAGQTLTGLGKWWGRKPLVLVRALILGLLLPATEDPEADRETFLALMTMDDAGLVQRLEKPIPPDVAFKHLPYSDRVSLFDTNGKVSWKKTVDKAERGRAQERAFRAMSYDDKLAYCLRPEQVDGPTAETWARINRHLGTNASSLPALVRELGELRFGHVPKVGDAFCGGGSVPFEAARIGCGAFASDLNPVAGLLTWGSLNIAGGTQETLNRVGAAQERVFAAVQTHVDSWGIERNELGWIADNYLYCVEVRDPTTGWLVPLAPSWVVAAKTNVIARLTPDSSNEGFDIEILEGVSSSEMEQSNKEGTSSGGIRCPVDRHGHWLEPEDRIVTSIEQVRGPQGLRRWTNDDLVPRPEDTYQERLYCIRWLDPSTGQRHYRAPTATDLDREEQVLGLLRERFGDWQARGILPSRPIEPGAKTDEPIRTRGWTHWHHLFNPRQLLLAGLLGEQSAAEERSLEKCALLLWLGKVADWNSRLCRWNSAAGNGTQVFYNQALNTLDNYSCRPTSALRSTLIPTSKPGGVLADAEITVADARSVQRPCDIWVTDPGYGDSVLYAEISEFFLAWYDKRLTTLFPDWYSDSKRALAVEGTGEHFRVVLGECYGNLARRMPDDGFQVVMFTHQDPETWADLGLALWGAGLQVSAAWTVVTETPSSGVKGGGNYVTGTVLLVLRKRQGDRRGDLSDLYPQIQTEVKQQIESMLALDDRDDPNFGDADYQLAAYAAALRVLTSYATIEEIDVQRELARPRRRGETTELAKLIGQAVRIASDYLVPQGLDRAVWRKLTPEERLYLKGIQVEAGGEAREGVYQEFARSYGAGPHKELYASRTANKVRFKTPSEMAGRDLRSSGGTGFPSSHMRDLLYAVYATAADPERNPRVGRDYLRRELPNYWSERQSLADLLDFLIKTADPLSHWQSDLAAARLLRDSLLNDSM